MNITRTLSAAFVMAASVLTASADLPFRQHRYDSFRATPTEEGQIVFAGNSITNMNSWFESYGSNQEIIGRGNSGGMASEMVEELESYIDSKPSKLFMMIGTNDISSGTSYKLTARRIEAMIQRIRLESPETEVYIQSILPRSNNAKPDFGLCNELVSEYISELNDPKVHFIDLSEVCAGLNGNATWTHDGLHPRPIGYAAWTNHIAPLVGYESVYPTEITEQNSCGLGRNSEAARAEQFAYMPVKSGDVLFFGDEQVHGGEWHELLRSNKIKDRGMKWGWGGIALTNAKEVVANALSGQAEKPAKIFLFYGVGGKVLDNYRLLVDEAKTQAPEAKIYIVSLTPSTNSTTDADNVEFNTQLQTIAEEKGATYVDIYSPLNANRSLNIMHTNYVSGRGYVVMANTLAQYLEEEEVNPVTLEEYTEVYNRRTARKILGIAINTALMVEYGTQPGQIKEQYREQISQAINEAVTAINDPELNSTRANEAARALNAVVNTAADDDNTPLFSTADEVYRYVLTSQRGNKVLTSTANGKAEGTTATPEAVSLGNDVWELRLREDDSTEGTFDLVNANGFYIDPTAKHDTQLSVTTERPAKGFNIRRSNHSVSSYVIYNSTCQLNQTGNAAVYNWYGQGGSPNLSDQGCAYTFTLFTGDVVLSENTPDQSGWYEVTRAADNMAVTNLNSPARQNATHSYSLQYIDQPEATSPKEWIYINVDENGNRSVRTLNGFDMGEFISNTRTSWNLPITLSQTVIGAFNVKYWSAFTIDGVTNVVGRSSSYNDPHKFRRVKADELAAYDLWTVEIQANTHAEPCKDTYVVYENAANKGITHIYNHGSIFTAPGTEITPADLTVVPAEGVEQKGEAPVVIIDSDAKTITVSLTGEIEAPEVAATEPLAEGWYSITLTGFTSGTHANLPGWINTAIEEGTTSLHAIETEYPQDLNGNRFYYHVGVSAPSTLTSPVLTYFFISQPELAKINIKSQNGHYVMDNGTASRQSVDIDIADLTDRGNASMPLCLWKNNSIGAPHDLLGKFSGNSCKYHFEPADTSAYDVYQVEIIGETAADELCNDLKISLAGQAAERSAATAGLSGVYNGGYLFVDKGSALAADDIDAPAHGTVDNPLITVTDKLITVDYTKELSGITELKSKSEAAPRAFDLWGRRAASPRHGIYIVNGRKVRI